MPLVSITDKRPQHRKQKKKTLFSVHITTVIDILVGIGTVIGNICFHHHLMKVTYCLISYYYLELNLDVTRDI